MGINHAQLRLLIFSHAGVRKGKFWIIKEGTEGQQNLSLKFILSFLDFKKNRNTQKDFFYQKEKKQRIGSKSTAKQCGEGCAFLYKENYMVILKDIRCNNSVDIFTTFMQHTSENIQVIYNHIL